MEKFKQGEKEHRNRGEIKNLTKFPDGRISFDFGPGSGLDGDISAFLISPELQESLGIKGLLLDGMKIEVTTDKNHHIIKVEKIL